MKPLPPSPSAQSLSSRGAAWMDAAGTLVERIRKLPDLAAAVDPQLLDQCPWAERARHLAVGLLILLITALNFFSTVAALELVFQPGKEMNSWLWALRHGGCLLAGGLWALIILNLYRFLGAVVQQTEAPASFTAAAVLRMLPRVLIILGAAALIGMSVAVPVTVWIVRTDIQSQLTQGQLRAVEALQRGVELRQAGALQALYENQVDKAEEIGRAKERIRNLLALHGAREAGGDIPPADAGQAKAPPAETATAADTADGDQLAQTQRALVALEADVAKISESIASLRAQVRQDKAAAQARIENSDSLFTEAGRVLEHGAGLYWAVALFMTILHASPVVLRLFCHRGPYEHLVDIQNEIVYAKYGIARDAVTLRDEDGNEYVLDKHLVADEILDMTRAALAKYHQDLMQNVRDRANRKLNAIRAIRSG
jgi:hypothetical protein